MSGPHDFDFLHGEWEVRHRRRTDFLDPDSAWEEFPSTARCRPLFDGAANIDEIDMPHLGAKGLTLRLFDPGSGQWSLNWASSRSGRLFPPVIGGFGESDGNRGGRPGRGEFHGDDTHDGKNVRARFVWSAVCDAAARWEQAFSLDGGETWLTNWVMDFTRPEAGREPVSETRSA
ncbi:hypothetical protein [Streptomyces rishiriensis]|uniref:DUF1579 domain-containing protein n=1 Tax=Streptomyces rishiriensis TaxID=68264 RepID=A0ABU0NZ50_STRRH|nr:hypothetical protein [Streptomyces rishiriensis]MDQ0584426.1 hypothetical protein [Streptomyces rishiriensis]